MTGDPPFDTGTANFGGVINPIIAAGSRMQISVNDSPFFEIDISGPPNIANNGHMFWFRPNCV